jgi:hypothetical protein
MKMNVGFSGSFRNDGVFVRTLLEPEMVEYGEIKASKGKSAHCLINVRTNTIFSKDPK